MHRFRPRTFVVAAAIVIIAVVATWAVWWLRGPANVRARGVGPAINLRVNALRRAEIVAGDPLLFEVSLTSSAERDDGTVGDPGRPWPTLIRLVHGESEPLPWPVSVLGAARTLTTQVRDGALPSVRSARNDVAVLKPGQVHQAVLAVSPETMTAAATGTYQIRAVLEQPSQLPWMSSRTLMSAPVTVVVLPAPRPRSERERLALSARYYLLANRPEEARRAASDLVGLDPKDVGAAMLLGDALAALGQKREALVAYRAALANSPRSYESPTLLYERIDSVSK